MSLHGIEFINLTSGPRPTQTPRTAVIGLIGTAPLIAVAVDDRTVNNAVTITSMRDAERFFGPEMDGYTIPAALRAIFDQGGALVEVINVFNPAVHKLAVAEDEFEFSESTGKIQLPDVLVLNVVVKNEAGDVTYVLGTDYELDPVAGVITPIDGGDIDTGDPVKVAYDKSTPGDVDSADIIGDSDPRTGIQVLEEIGTLRGYKPKILIAPSYSTATSVVTALQAMAAKCTGVAYIDAPADTTVSDAIAGRGALGSINFFTSDARTKLHYPLVKHDNGVELVPEFLSAYAAGLRASVDAAQGFWASTSNKEIRGISALERPIIGGLKDANSEAQRLNDVGITTVNVIGASGFRLWGNRMASYPSSATADTFEVVLRTGDVLEDALTDALLPFIDLPITPALIDAILQTANAYVRDLVRRRALLEGSQFLYLPEANPDVEVGQGHLTFECEYASPTPMERVTVRKTLRMDLYNLKAAA